MYHGSFDSFDFDGNQEIYYTAEINDITYIRRN